MIKTLPSYLAASFLGRWEGLIWLVVFRVGFSPLSGDYVGIFTRFTNIWDT